jgi:hypothetical protein
MEWLKPFMIERKYRKGDKLFSKAMPPTKCLQGDQFYPLGESKLTSIFVQLSSCISACRSSSRVALDRLARSHGLRQCNACSANMVWPAWRHRAASYRLSRSSGQLGKLARRK